GECWSGRPASRCCSSGPTSPRLRPDRSSATGRPTGWSAEAAPASGPLGGGQCAAHTNVNSMEGATHRLLGAVASELTPMPEATYVVFVPKAKRDELRKI